MRPTNRLQVPPPPKAPHNNPPPAPLTEAERDEQLRLAMLDAVNAEGITKVAAEVPSAVEPVARFLARIPVMTGTKAKFSLYLERRATRRFRGVAVHPVQGTRIAASSK